MRASTADRPLEASLLAALAGRLIWHRLHQQNLHIGEFDRGRKYDAVIAHRHTAPDLDDAVNDERLSWFSAYDLLKNRHWMLLSDPMVTSAHGCCRL